MLNFCDALDQVVVKRCSNVAVTVESSGLDMASLTMDDFTSQRLQERTESATDLQGQLSIFEQP